MSNTRINLLIALLQTILIILLGVSSSNGSLKRTIQRIKHGLNPPRVTEPIEQPEPKRLKTRADFGEVG